MTNNKPQTAAFPPPTGLMLSLKVATANEWTVHIETRQALASVKETMAYEDCIVEMFSDKTAHYQLSKMDKFLANGKVKPDEYQALIRRQLEELKWQLRQSRESV